jgi:hypothetical protein
VQNYFDAPSGNYADQHTIILKPQARNYGDQHTIILKPQVPNYADQYTILLTPRAQITMISTRLF